MLHLVILKIQLYIWFLRYLRLEYLPYTTLSELAGRFSQESLKNDPHQFVEALVYSKDTGVLMLGDMVDKIGKDGKVCI